MMLIVLQILHPSTLGVVFAVSVMHSYKCLMTTETEI